MSRSRSRNRPVSVGPDFQSLRSYSTSTTTSSSKTFQQSTRVTKLTFSEETKSGRSEKKVPEKYETIVPVVYRNKYPKSYEQKVTRACENTVLKGYEQIVPESYEETNIKSYDKKVTESCDIIDRGRSRQRKGPSAVAKTEQLEADLSKQVNNFGNPVPEKPVYKVKIVREEEEEEVSPLRAVVKIRQIEPQKATLKNVVPSDASKATFLQKPTLDQPTYRDYIVNKKHTRRPLSCDGSSAFPR